MASNDNVFDLIEGGEKLDLFKTSPTRNLYRDANVMMAREIREGVDPLVNPDGTISTHRMVSGEITNIRGEIKYVAFPTLFPGYRNEELQVTEEWGDLNNEEGFPEEAYKEAYSRNEVFYFDTQEEAEAFAEGSWKE